MISQSLGTLLFTIGVLLMAGCRSSSYQMVEAKAVQPAAPLGLTATAAGLELSVTGIIVSDGPGTWKQHAYWDEYVVRLVNHRAEPLTVELIELSDGFDRRVPSGTDPWALEKTGTKHVKSLQRLHAPADTAGSTRQRAQPHMSVAEGAAGVAGLAFVSIFYVPGLAPAVAGPALLYGAPLVFLAYSPIYLANKLVIDPKNRGLVLTEFNRRRLSLPVTIAPGATVTGSVFFPLTPGQERISAHARSGQEEMRVILDLPGLERAPLHLSAR
jgi:hypothetical protein